jgi:hypothetical protein
MERAINVRAEEHHIAVLAGPVARNVYPLRGVFLLNFCTAWRLMLSRELP